MNKLNYFLALVFAASFAQATEMGVPVQLKLQKPDGTYPSESGVSVVMRVLAPAGGCVLREESFSNQTITSGTISLALGSGTPSGDDPGLTLAAAYDNSTAKINLDCVDANNNPTASGQTYNPIASDTRVIRFTATVDGTPINVDFIQRAVPYAIHADSVGGKASADILVQNAATSLNQTNLETLLSNLTRYNRLHNLAVNGIADSATTATTAGSATNFSGSLTGDVTGTQSATTVAGIRGVTVAATAPASGQVLGYNGAQYVPMTFVASAPVQSVNGQQGAVVLDVSHIAGALTSSSAFSGDVTGNAAATVVANVGGKSAAAVAGAVNTVTSASALATPSTLVMRDGSGNVVASNLAATGASVQNLYLYGSSPSDILTISAPNAFTSYALVFPNSNGNPGEVLQTDGNGVLSWSAGAAVTSGQIVSALGYTPADDAAVVKRSNNLSDVVSAGAARTNLGLGSLATANSVDLSTAQATGTLANARLPSFAGDVNSSAGSNSLTVTKVQGVGVSFAAIANNHLLQYDGTNVVNRAVPTCGAGEYLTFNGSAWSCATDVGASAVTAVNVTAPISSTGGTTPTLSMAQASGSANGYLASADWTTFNNKMAATSAAVIAALGYTPASSTASGSFAAVANNLSDLTSATVARTNLGLGAAAILNVGAAAGTVAAGDDSRITGALQSTAFNTYVASASCTSGQTMYWNSVSSTFACQNILVSGDISGVASSVTVTRVQNTGVSFSSIANGHILQYNGTNIINRAIPTCSAGQYLTFNGAAWSCAADAGSGGVVSAVAVTAPLQSTGGSNPTLSMPVATSSANGYLSSADWTTFNSKITSSAAAIAQVLGFSPANSATTVVRANNLSDLANVATARTNLGLGTFATASTVDLGSASATGTLATARLPALTGDVTSTAGSNAMTVEKIRGVNVNAAAPNTGDILVYNGSEWVPTAGPRAARVTANQTINGTTYTDVTNMNFSVVSGRTYKFKFNILYATSATTRGLRLRINHGGATAYSVLYSVPASTTYGTGYIAAGSYDASGDTFTAATATPSGIQIAYAEGIIVASANGTVQLVASQSNTGNLTIYAGSLTEFREIP